MDLIADIGATNTRCALLDPAGEINSTQVFANSGFESLTAVLRQFAAGTGASIQRAALAIAAPLASDQVSMTNIGWSFSRKAMQDTLQLDELLLLNDFEALAHALPHLDDNVLHRVGGGEALPGRAMAVLGPGSGLGVASVAPHGDQWTAVSAEGGHVSMPALDEIEAEIIADNSEPNGHCSAETLLSGPGLVNIHRSLSKLLGDEPDPLAPADVTRLASSGDVIAEQTLEVFFAMLGTVAGNLALTVGARGGIFIGGGIVPRVLPAFEQSSFRERFEGKGRYRSYMESIPSAVITEQYPALVGLRQVLR